MRHTSGALLQRKCGCGSSCCSTSAIPAARSHSEPPIPQGAGHNFGNVRVIQRKSDEQAQPETDNAESTSDAETESGGLCLRTPLPPGIVRFEGCSAAQLGRYRVLPEEGDQPILPSADTDYAADGIWNADHVPSSEWFKVPSHCDATVRCSGQTFTWTSCCNAAASLFKGTPRWVNDDHAAKGNLPAGGP